MSQREQAATTESVADPVDANGKGVPPSGFGEGASRPALHVAAPRHIGPALRGAAPRAADLPRLSNDAVDEILTALNRIELAQIALQKQVDVLQEHSNLVGYLVEQTLARTRPRGWAIVGASKLSASSRVAARKIAAGFGACARFLRPLAEPGLTAQSIKRALELARVTSRRASWSKRRQKWRQRLDWRLYAISALVQVGGVFINRRQPLYSVRQRRPTIVGARPRILHVIANVHLGGSTQLVVDLFDHLAHKYEMQVATSSLPPGGVHSGMIIHDLREPTSLEPFVDLFRKFAPDILHVHYWGDVDRPWYEKAFAAARLAGHRMVENVNTPVAAYLDDRVERYIFVSDYVRREFGSGSERDLVIHPGIDLVRFAARDFHPHAHGSIGMVYRLEPDKLNAESIEPLIRTVLARPKIRAFVIGGGSLLDVFLRRVGEAGVRDNFVFTGYVPYRNLPDYYSQFRTFVAPVWQESFGQAAVFAMNMGMAVVGNRIGALPEILGDEDMLGSSVEETASKLVSLLDDPNRIIEIGARNRNRAQKMFDVETMCRRYGRVYDEVLGRGDSMPGFPPAEIFDAS